MANEKRLVDANDFLDLFYVASVGQNKAFIEAVKMVVEDTPTVDAVEVVRCKDCKWWQRKGLCPMPDYNGESFCSYGERKEA